MKKSLLGIIIFLSLNSTQAQENTDNSQPDTLHTRFGEIIFTDDFTVSFRDKEIVGVDFILPHYVLGKFELKSSDIILYQAPGGTACPGQYSYIIIDENSASSTSIFGTCYDDDGVVPIQIGNTVSFSMHKLGGEGSTLYSFQDGEVYEKDGVLMLSEDVWDIDYMNSSFLKK